MRWEWQEIRRTNGTPLGFAGHLLATVDNQPAHAGTPSAIFAPAAETYSILSLYRVRNGGFAGHRVQCRQGKVEPDFATAAFLLDMTKAREFFGDGTLAQQLFEIAGQDADQP